MNSVALIGTIVICVVILLLHSFSDIDRAQPPRGFLQIRYATAGEKKAIQSLLKKYARRNRVLSERKVSERNEVEVFYRVTLRRGLSQAELVRELQALEFVSDVQWIAEEAGNETSAS